MNNLFYSKFRSAGCCRFLFYCTSSRHPLTFSSSDVSWGWDEVQTTATHQALQPQNVTLTPGDRLCQGWCPGLKRRSAKAPQLVSMPQHVWLKCLAVHHNNKMWHFSEAVKLQSKKWSWLGTAPEDRRRAFNLLVMGKMEEDKIPIQPFLQGPKWSHCNPTGYLGHGRKFLKTNILEYNHTNSINAPNSSAHWKLWSQCLFARSC